MIRSCACDLSRGERLDWRYGHECAPTPGTASLPHGSYPRRWLALAGLCVSLLIVNLDSTVLNVALPTLVRDLHATDSQLQWIVDSYVMVFAGLLLVVGSLADRLGRKRAFLAGLAAFTAGSAWPPSRAP